MMKRALGESFSGHFVLRSFRAGKKSTSPGFVRRNLVEGTLTSLQSRRSHAIQPEWQFHIAKNHTPKSAHPPIVHHAKKIDQPRANCEMCLYFFRSGVFPGISLSGVSDGGQANTFWKKIDAICIIGKCFGVEYFRNERISPGWGLFYLIAIMLKS